MLGKQNIQTSFMDIETWCGGPLVPQDSIYDLLSKWGDRLIRDEDFASLFSSTGRPCVSPALLAKVLLLMYHDNTTDREAHERAMYDLRWKVALQLPLGESGFDFTALSRFRARLLTNKQQKLVFERFLQLAKEVGIVKDGSVQIIDSSNILGACAVKDTYTLIRTAIQKVLGIRTRKQGQLPSKLALLATQLDYSQQGKPDIDWDDPKARQQLLQSLAADSAALVKSLAGIELSEDELAAVDLLATVTQQDVETNEDGTITLRQGVAKDRIISVEDPDMRHGHKTSTGKFDGHKGQFLIDAQTEIITNIAVTSGNQADAEAIDHLLDSSKVKPAILLGDTAYGTLLAREATQKHQVIPAAPLPMGKPAAGKFGKYDFRIDWQTTTCTCPGEQTTTKTYTDKQGTIVSFVFPKQQCNPCPLRDQCTKHGKGKVLVLHEKEQKRREIIDQTNTPAFKELYRKRSTVERKIAHVMRRGMRKARYIGKAKTLTQLAFTSTVVNIKRMFTLLAGDVSAFARLTAILR